MRTDFFSEWKRQKGSGASYMALIRAFLRIGCKEHAEYVCRLKSTASSWTFQSPGIYAVMYSYRVVTLPKSSALRSYIEQLKVSISVSVCIAMYLSDYVASISSYMHIRT